MFRRKRNASDFSAEIEAHIELETERLQEQGLSDETRAQRGAARIRQRDEFAGALLRIRPLARVGSLLAGHSLRRAHAAQVSGLHRHRDFDDCAGHRSDDGDFQRRRCHAVASAAVPASGAAREHRG